MHFVFFISYFLFIDICILHICKVNLNFTACGMYLCIDICTLCLLTARVVSYQTAQKDASYISVSSRPSAGRALGTQMLQALGLRAAATDARILRLTDADKPSVFQLRKSFRRLAFRQVQQIHTNTLRI